MKITRFIQILLLVAIFTNVFGILFVPNTANAFVPKNGYSDYNPPGFFSGIWHGLLAPWSLIARLFMDDVVMYAVPNTGWFYDTGFLIGVAGSIPIGWAAAILSTIGHIIS